MKHLLLFILIFATSCSKTSNDNRIQNNINAQLIYTGDIATDGCGSMIMTNDSLYYHPDVLPDEFTQKNLPVLVTFVKTSDSFGCGIAGNAFDIIHIISIKPR